MIFHSFKFKISVLYSLIVGAVLILYSLFLYWTLSAALYSELDKELKLKARATIKVMDLYVKAVGESPRVLDYVFNRISFPEDVDVRLELLAKIDFYWTQQFDKLSMQDDLLHLVAPSGESVGRSRRLYTDLRNVFLEELPRVDPEREFTFSDIHYKNRVYRMVSVRCFLNNRGPYLLQIASSQKPVIQILKGRLYAILVSVPVIFILMFFLGRFFVNQMMRPVVKVTKTAETISHKDLSARIHLSQDDADMQRLVNAFNDMIARLERSFKHIEEFSSQVAHELRTPLAIMRGESELALRKDRDVEEYKRVIRVNLEELGRMLRTVEDLLLLTKIDYHPGVFKKEPFDFGVFCREVFEQAKILGDEKGVAISFELAAGAIPVTGDRTHLRRLFYNLIHNAVKFTPAGGAVVVAAAVQDGRVMASVSDTGPGIPDQDLPRIFDRFFHKGSADSQEDPGSGLGLSIALAIARSHGGDIKAESRPGKGSIFTVTLPLG
ncbi:MAG: HAMP domain-containing protein [Candidatus Omnitrophica bacterium]|nr:HAMP domain-containing protein [Candidatus Omnitrophota bacterium]